MRKDDEKSYRIMRPSDDILAGARKATDEFMDKAMLEGFERSTATAPSLNFNELAKAIRTMDRYSKVYFLSTKNLPDDCYGIMYVRPEDMPNQKDKSQ